MSHEHIEEYDPARSVFRIAEIALNGPIIPGTLKGAIRLLTTYEKQFRGVIAELRARLVIGSLPIVEDVQKAPLFNDTHLHDDFYIIYKDGINPDIPLQVKSSESAVEQFERDGRNPRKEKVVLDCGPQTTDEKILESYFKQSADIRSRMLDKKRQLRQDKSR